jgi:hypothetical protein
MRTRQLAHVIYKESTKLVSTHTVRVRGYMYPWSRPGILVPFPAGYTCPKPGRAYIFRVYMSRSRLGMQFACSLQEWRQNWGHVNTHRVTVCKHDIYIYILYIDVYIYILYIYIYIYIYMYIVHRCIGICQAKSLGVNMFSADSSSCRYERMYAR